jgi:hypothetical protein
MGTPFLCGLPERAIHDDKLAPGKKTHGSSPRISVVSAVRRRNHERRRLAGSGRPQGVEHLVSSGVGLKREFWCMSCSLSQKLLVVALLLSPLPALAAGSGGGASGSGGGSSSGTAGGSTGASPNASTGGSPSSGTGTTLSNGVTVNGTGGAPGANASNAKSEGTTGNNLGPAGTPGSSNTLNNAVGNLGNTNTGVTAPSSNSSVQTGPSGK